MPFVAQGAATNAADTRVYVRVTPAGPLIDPDAGTLTLQINDPNGDPVLTVVQASLTRESLGIFSYSWLTAVDQAIGPYAFLWDAEVEGAELPTAVDEVEVIPAGTLGVTIVSVAQMRAYLETTLADADLLLLIAIAEAELTARIGPVGSVTEIIDGFTHRIVLSRPALAITSITETDTGTTTTTLAANDYSLRSPYVLERLTTGTNAAQTWNYRATVTYTPVDDILLRQGVVIDLVRMYVNRNPGLSSFTIGSWSETYSSHGEYDSEREAILARLDPAPKMRIV